MIRIIWYGQSCFELCYNGLSIILDPYEPWWTGLPGPTDRKADIVLCSHDHHDHCNYGAVLKEGGSFLINFIGFTKIGSKEVIKNGKILTTNGIEVKGITSFHDALRQRSGNSIYVFTIGDIKFCHLGDLGHDLDNNEVKEIGEVDILFLPVGGCFVISPEVALSVFNKINAKIVLPMHYKIQGLSPLYNGLCSIDDFVKGRKDTELIDGSIIEVSKESLPLEKKIIILSLWGKDWPGYVLMQKFKETGIL